MLNISVLLLNICNKIVKKKNLGILRFELCCVLHDHLLFLLVFLQLSSPLSLDVD